MTKGSKYIIMNETTQMESFFETKLQAEKMFNALVLLGNSVSFWEENENGTLSFIDLFVPKL